MFDLDHILNERNGRAFWRTEKRTKFLSKPSYTFFGSGLECTEVLIVWPCWPSLLGLGSK